MNPTQILLLTIFLFSSSIHITSGLECLHGPRDNPKTVTYDGSEFFACVSCRRDRGEYVCNTFKCAKYTGPPCKNVTEGKDCCCSEDKCNEKFKEGGEKPKDGEGKSNGDGGKLTCKTGGDADIPSLLKNVEVDLDGVSSSKTKGNCKSCGKTKTKAGFGWECFEDKCGEGDADDFPKAGEECKEETGGVTKCCCEDKNNCNGGMGMFPRIRSPGSRSHSRRNPDTPRKSPVKKQNDEINQVFTTNLWLELQWRDPKLSWEPKKYGGVEKLHMPSDQIWTPDIILYNYAGGSPDITIDSYTPSLVYFDGTVIWKPPAIYKSFCPIDVTWFPYDLQECQMKFGTWSYDGYYLDLRLLPEDLVILGHDPGGSYETVEKQEIGMDLSYFDISAEWDLLQLASARHEIIYRFCCGPYKFTDITYYFTLRRKTLFYTVNIIIPCFLISFLTTFVFYLSDHKITYSISLLVTLTWFLLVLVDLMPPTSTAIPMIGRYLLVTMVLVAVSIVISVVSVNFNYRHGSSHIMPTWIRKLFLCYLPILLRMEKPDTSDSMLGNEDNDIVLRSKTESRPRLNSLIITSEGLKIQPPPPILLALDTSWEHETYVSTLAETPEERRIRVHRQIMLRMLQHVRFILDHYRVIGEQEEISGDWSFVAMVIDRMFFIICGVLNALAIIFILQAPVLYDQREPLSIPHAMKPVNEPFGTHGN